MAKQNCGGLIITRLFLCKASLVGTVSQGARSDKAKLKGWLILSSLLAPRPALAPLVGWLGGPRRRQPQGISQTYYTKETYMRGKGPCAERETMSTLTSQNRRRLNPDRIRAVCRKLLKHGPTEESILSNVPHP